MYGGSWSLSSSVCPALGRQERRGGGVWGMMMMMGMIMTMSTTSRGWAALAQAASLRLEQLLGVFEHDEQHGGRGHAPDERGPQAGVQRGHALVPVHAHHAERPAAGGQRVVQLYARLDHVHRERDRPQEHAARRAGHRRGPQAAVGARPARRLQRLAHRLVHAEETEVAGHLPGHRHRQAPEQAAHPVVPYNVLRKNTTS